MSNKIGYFVDYYMDYLDSGRGGAGARGLNWGRGGLRVVLSE